MWQRPLSSDPANESLHPPKHEPEGFTREEQTALLQVAHQAIAAAVEGRTYTPTSISRHLEDPRGVFTTLYRDGHLRGCVGYVSAIRPLMEAVAETARAAALEDSRFDPVRLDELPEIQVSLSVLSPTFAIVPDQIQIGRHGLVIRHHGRRGLLLPQVATEHGWDVETFLEQTCLKAGLPGNEWKHGAEIEAFTAEIFGDEDLHD